MSASNLNTRFQEAVAAYAGETCYVEGERLWTWGQIGQLAKLAAYQISKLGLPPKTPVGLLLPNSSLFAFSFFGALMAECVPMPMNPLLKPPEQAAQLNDSGARLVLTITHFRELVEAAVGGAKVKPFIFYFDEMPMPPPAALFEEANSWASAGGLDGALGADPDSLAVLLYTSGSTGEPKGVMLSHANLLSNIDAVLPAFQIEQSDVFLSALPFFHIFGLMTCMILPLLRGLKAILIARVSPDAMLEAIQRHKVTVFILAPALYYLLATNRNAPQTDFGSVRFAVSGGSALSDELVGLVKAKTGVDVYNGYGATETSPVISVDNPFVASRRGSVGKPITGVEVQIADGEICARGANVMRGYLNKPDQTARVIDAEGWYHTRDLGYVDEDGFLFVKGRMDDLIIVAGKNVFPEDIERVLAQHPGVREAAVAGIPDKSRGQAVAAFIIAEGDTPPPVAELRAFCAARLAPNQTPREFWFVSEFPRNLMGKVQKFRLVEEKIRATETQGTQGRAENEKKE